MSSFKKFAWSGSAVVLAVVMALALMVTPAFAATTVAAVARTVSISTNTATGTGACTTLPSVVMSEAAAGDTTTGQTFILTLPAGWSYCATGSIAVAGVTTSLPSTVPVTAAAALTNATTITGTTSGTSATNPVKYTWSSIGVRPDTAATATGNVALTGTGVTANAAAVVLTAGGSMTAAYNFSTFKLLAPGVTCDATGITQALAQPVTVLADASAAWVLCAQLNDDVGNAASGALVTLTVSIGVVSTGTSKSTSSTTNSTGYVTTTYRGQGNATATDTAIATFTLKNAVITQTVNLTPSSGGTASKITIGAPNVLAVAPTVTNTSPGYVSPTIGTRSYVWVQDAAGLGVNNQVVLLTTDRGSLVDGMDQACAGVTAKSITATTATEAQVLNGTTQAGTIAFTICTNQLDAPGKATITAQNISTAMANSTFAVADAGRPAKITATVTGNSIAVTVTDANGNNVADGTPVRFTMSQNAGAVSTTCTSTTNGAASAVVALVAASGTVIVSTDWNETGATVPGCAAAAAGNQTAQVTATTGSQTIAASATVPGGAAAPAPAGGTGALTSGSVPAAGGFGLIVFGGGTTAQLVTASACPSATSAFWFTSGGNFLTYVPGTTIAAVNADFLAAFPGGNIPANTPFIGKCK